MSHIKEKDYNYAIARLADCFGDLQEQIKQLQKQLAEKDKRIDELEGALSESIEVIEFYCSDIATVKHTEKYMDKYRAIAKGESE